MKFTENCKDVLILHLIGKTDKEIGEILNKSKFSIFTIRKGKEFKSLLMLFHYNKRRLMEIFDE